MFAMNFTFELPTLHIAAFHRNQNTRNLLFDCFKVTTEVTTRRNFYLLTLHLKTHCNFRATFFIFKFGFKISGSDCDEKHAGTTFLPNRRALVNSVGGLL